MRVLISADREGATGVTWADDCVAGTQLWQRMRRLSTGDVHACVAGLVAGGATDVLREGARAAMERAGWGAERVTTHRVEIEFDAAHLAGAAAVVPTVEQRGVRTVGFEAPTMTAAHRAVKIVASVAAGAMQGIHG